MDEIPEFITEGLDSVTLQKMPDVADFRNSLDAETDRGCAIAAVSFVDSELAKAIKARLIDSEKIIKTVFEGQGGLSTFSSRIDVGFL